MYYITDANHNITALVDASRDSGGSPGPRFGQVVERYLYDPYGRVTVLNGAADKDSPTNGPAVAQWSPDADDLAASQGMGTPTDRIGDWDNEILFAGYRYDPATGLYHVRHRVYDVCLGWLQRDPIGYADGPSMYVYCGAGPAVATDAFGLEGSTSAPAAPMPQKYSNADVAKMEQSLALWQQRLARLQAEVEAAQQKKVAPSDALLADIDEKKRMVASITKGLTAAKEKEAAWNRLDTIIADVVAEFNKNELPRLLPKATPPLDPSLVKALLFSETEIGTGSDYVKLVAIGKQALDDYDAARREWEKSDKKSPAPAFPPWLYQLNIGRVTDASLYNDVSREFKIASPPITDCFKLGTETDIRLAVGALVLKLKYALQNSNNKFLQSKDPWMNAATAYKGVSAEGQRKANLVWRLYKQGMHPYTQGVKLW